MQLRYEQLQAHVNKALAPVYLLSGAEPFLIDEGRRIIHAAAHKQGYTERQSWQVETGFAWQQLLTSANALSLFSNKELIEIRCTSNQLNETAAKILQSYIDNIPPDKILLIITDKLTPAQQKSSWYQNLLKAGVAIQIWPLESDALLQWLKQRMTAAKLTTSPEGLQLLAERAEGNLLAIAQEIEKLSLLYPQQTLTVENIAEAVNDSARFDVFALSDAILQGNGNRIVRILYCLKDEGIEPILILWAVTKEIRTLTTIIEQLVQGANIEKILIEQRIWDKRKPLIRQALQRHKLKAWHQLLQQASTIDCMIKGLKPGNVWDELIRLCLSVAGIKLVTLSN
jgi:DNA polymerase-3 subunit delta